jgi:26S proteasome non-ATPase regulatory subunit 9
MSNLHAPTVPSGPTSTGAAADGVGKLTFPQLQRKKDDLEAELKALGRVLDSVWSWWKQGGQQTDRRWWEVLMEAV